MKNICLFFAAVVLLFQISPGYTQPPFHDDTVACREAFGFCKSSNCPPANPETGTCVGGTWKCCAKSAANFFRP